MCSSAPRKAKRSTSSTSRGASRWRRSPVGARPRGIGFSPDGKRAYVAAENSNEVYVIDAVGFNVLAKIKAGLRSNGIAVHPDGKRVFVSNGGDATVSVIDAASQRHHRDDSGRAAALEHGAHCRRQEALRRLRAFGHRLGHRHRARSKIADIAVGKLPWGVAIR